MFYILTRLPNHVHPNNNLESRCIWFSELKRFVSPSLTYEWICTNIGGMFIEPHAHTSVGGNFLQTHPIPINVNYKQ